MREGDEIQEHRWERAYLSTQLEEAAKELARLDLLNLTLTRQRRQAVAAFHLIKVLQEKIEKALTADDMYLNVVKTLTSELFMDSAAVLRINFETRDIFLLASVGLPENIKGLKLDKNITKQQLLDPTFVNRKSSLQSFHKFVRKSFKYPYFIWYPIADEEGETLVLFVGNKVEDLVSKQPFSEQSLETFGAISSVILLRRDNIAYTQETLRKKEERIDFLAEILKSSPICVIAMDEDAKITYCNPATEKLYGYKAEELIGRDLGMLDAGPNATEVLREILATVRRGKIWRGEVLNRKKSGDLFYIYCSIYKLLDKKGNFIALVCFHEDITERKRAEEVLKESEEKFRNLAEQSPNMIFINERGRVVYANKKCEDIMGYTRDEFYSPDFDFLGLIAPESTELVNSSFASHMKGEEIEPYGYSLVTKDGERIEAILNTTLINYQGERAILGTVTDITERKRAEQRLREYEARYRHLLDHMPDGVALTHRRRIIRVNPPMARMFSYPSAEKMEGLSLMDLASPGSREIIRRQSTPRALGRQGENRFEFQALRKDGSTFSAECTLTIDRGEAKPFGLAIIRDVTESKTYEEQRKLFSERIIVAQEKEHALIARELHDELGQALTAIKMDMAWIKSHVKGAGEAISDRFEALGKLVDTTIESVQKMAASLHPSVLDQLGLTAAIEWYAGEFERRTGIECIIKSESADFNIDSNAAINVYRIFQEALTNVARHARASRVDVRMAQNRGYLTICISDNGRGILSQKLSGAMSLGIAGMRERAELVKGRLDIQSRRGKGTKVTVYLPTSP
jgi:PAS domain S-box-containing protein